MSGGRRENQRTLLCGSSRPRAPRCGVIIPGEGAITGIRDLAASPGGPLYVATGKTTVSKKTSSIVLTALSAQGELLWEKTAPGPPDAPFGKTVALASAEVIALNDGCLMLIAKGKELALLRFGKSGELVSSQDIPLPLISELADIAMLGVGEAVMSPDGGMWLVGSWGPISFTSWIARLNPAGTLTWSHAQPSKGLWRYLDIAAMPDNSVLVVGRAPAGNDRGLYSARISPEGKTLWSCTTPVAIRVDPGVAITKSMNDYYVSGVSDPMKVGGSWLTRFNADEPIRE